MIDWLRIYFAPLPLTSYSLAGLFLLAALEFLGLRQPIRDGFATVRAWLVAKALALRSMLAAFGREVRDFWRWPWNQPPPVKEDGFDKFVAGAFADFMEGLKGDVCRRPRPKPEDTGKKVTKAAKNRRR